MLARTTRELLPGVFSFNLILISYALPGGARAVPSGAVGNRFARRLIRERNDAKGPWSTGKTSISMSPNEVDEYAADELARPHGSAMGEELRKRGAGWMDYFMDLWLRGEPRGAAFYHYNYAKLYA